LFGHKYPQQIVAKMIDKVKMVRRKIQRARDTSLYKFVHGRPEGAMADLGLCPDTGSACYYSQK